MAGVLVGFVLGIIGSLLAWFLTAGYLTPKIEIRNTVEAVPGTKSLTNYQFAIRNRRWFRDAQDVTIRVRCRIPIKDRQDLMHAFSIPVDDEWLPVVRSQWYFRHGRRRDTETWTQYLETMTQLIPPWISNEFELPKDECGQVDLPQILHQFDGILTFVVISYDSWSGTKGVSITYFAKSDIA